MLIVRIIITFIASVIGLILGVFISCFVGVSLMGEEAYSRTFQTHPMGCPALLSLIFIYTCALLVGFLCWRASRSWIKRFIERQASADGNTYIECGGADYPSKRGNRWHVSWPFAKLFVSKDNLKIQAWESCFVIDRDNVFSLARHRGFFSSCIEIMTATGERYCFWSFDIVRLIAGIRSFGYEVKE